MAVTKLKQPLGQADRQSPPGAPVPPILPPKEGFLMLDEAKFAASFAADVEPDLADFMGIRRCHGVWTH